MNLLAALLTVTAILSHEVEDSGGLLKTCHYNSPYGEFAITIRSTQLCPIVIEVEV